MILSNTIIISASCQVFRSFLAPNISCFFALFHNCKRRSETPSLKRPAVRLRRSKNPAADSSLPVGQRAGDEGRGALWTGALCSPAGRSEQSGGGSALWH